MWYFDTKILGGGNVHRIKNHPLLVFTEFRKLFIGRMISSIGDKFFTLALMWLVISKGNEGSTLQLGILMVINMLPVVLLGPAMGVLVDRFSKKKCMIIADFMRFLLVETMFIAIQKDSLSIQLLYVLCFGISSFIPLFEAAASSSLENLTDSNTISQAVAIDSSVIHISGILGAFIGGIVIACYGTEGAVFLNGISFLVSLILIISIKMPKIETPLEIGKKQNFSAFKEGFVFIYEKKAIFALLIVFSVFNFFAAPILMLMPLMVKYILKESAAWVGYFETFLALGAGIMTVMLSFKKKYSKIYFSVFINLVIIGASTLFLGVFINKYAMCLALFIIGMSVAVINTTAISLFQVEVPLELKGRFFGILTTASFAVMPISYLVNSILSERISIPKLLMVNGIASIILALVVIRIPRIKEEMDFTFENNGEDMEETKWEMKM